MMSSEPEGSGQQEQKDTQTTEDQSVGDRLQAWWREQAGSASFEGWGVPQ